MIEAVRITLMGMGLVFAAMALVLGAMLVLTQIRISQQPAQEAPGADETQAADDEHAVRARVAVIAAAIARAQAQQTPRLGAAPDAGALSPWLAFHRNRQLDRRWRKAASRS